MILVLNILHSYNNLVLGLCLIFILFQACIKGDENEIIHPTDENIPVTNSLALISKERNDIEDKELVRLGKRLNEATKVISIGESQGQREKIFGVVEKALLFEEYLYVLDSRASNVRVFDRDGFYIHTIGRGGNGPGEFVNAEDMFIDSGTMFVLDRSMKIETFDFSDRIKSFEYDSTLSLKSYALSFCQLGDSSIVVSDLTGTSEYLLSEYGRDGRLKGGIRDIV